MLNDIDMGQDLFPARSKQFIRSTSIFLFEFFGEYKQHTDQYAIKTKNQNPFYPKPKETICISTIQTRIKFFFLRFADITS